jgi:hypothetical protein
MPRIRLLLLLGSLSAFCGLAQAKHYLILKSGAEIECAILRQDTAVVVVTDWESRALMQPDLQVYSVREVESVWFQKPHTENFRRRLFVPHTSGREVGGGFAFQQWAESTLKRRGLLMLSLHGGYSIVKELGMELDASFTLPTGGKTDSVWQSYDLGYQATMNVVAHPWVLGGFIPFALVGGGAAVGVPTGDVLITSSEDIRNLVVLGFGAKWGWNGLGFRAEARHHF